MRYFTRETFSIQRFLLSVLFALILFLPTVSYAQQESVLQRAAATVFCNINIFLFGERCDYEVLVETGRENDIGSPAFVPLSERNPSLSFIPNVKATEQEAKQSEAVTTLLQTINQPVIERTIETREVVREPSFTKVEIEQELLGKLASQIEVMGEQLYQNQSTPYDDSGIWRTLSLMNVGGGGSTNTDSQTLSFDTGTNILTVSGGNTVDLSILDGGGGGGGLATTDIDTSAELAAILGDETGSGALVFGTSPTLTTPDLGTPSALTLTNATGLPLTTGVTGTLDISDNTNLAAGAGATLTGDTLSVDLGTTIESSEITNATIDEVDLDTSVNASLDLADSALQSGDNISELTNDSGFITSADDTVSGTELDGVFSTAGLLLRTGAATYSTVTNNTTNWNTAFGWGDHALGGYLTTVDISDDTNLVAGTGITLTGDTLSVDLGTSIDISDETNLAVGNGITLTGDTLTVSAAGGLTQAAGGLTTTGILEDLNTLGTAASDGEFIVATGVGTFAYESGATARTSLGLGNVENTALSTWAGTTNITTLGTIATGVWNGTAVDISDYTNLVAGTNITLTGDTLNIDDAFISNTGDTITGPFVLDDTSLQIQEGVDTLTLTVPTLTADRAVTLPDAAGEISLLGQSIDISDETNLAGDSEIVLTGDALSIAASIARDTELHDEVTLGGSLDYLTLAGQVLTRNAVDVTTDITGTLPVANGGTGATTLNDLITLGTHTTGNYLATLASGTGITITGSGSESAAASAALNTAADVTFTGDYDFGGGTLQLPNSTTLPVTCEVGDIYFDTDATSGQRVYGCESADTWALQGDGGDAALLTDGGTVTYLTATTDDFAIGGNSLAASIFSIDESAGTFLFGGDQSANPILRFEATDSDTADFGFNTNDSFYFSGGNVGVGLTDPDKTLEVFETVAEAQLKLSYDGTRYAQFQVDSVGDLIIDPQGDEVFLNDDNFLVCTGGSCPAGNPTGTGNIIAENKIGVGTTTPAAKLTIETQDAVTEFLTIASSTSGTLLVFDETGNLGIGTDAPVSKLAIGAGGAITTVENTLTDGATIAIDWLDGNQQDVTLGGNRTITFSNYIAGQILRLVVCQDGTGSRTLTWPASVVWNDGTAPTLTTTADQCDFLAFVATEAKGSLKIFGTSSLNF
jgi:hypothetical protein